MSWIITDDYIDGTDSFIANVRMGSRPITQLPENEFLLKDDDGVTYYRGYCEPEGWPACQFDPLDWAAQYAGCTEIWYRDKNGNFKRL